MGLSLSAAAAIIGISLVISLELLIGSIIPAVDNYSFSFNEMKNRAIEQVQTDINISNIATSANISNHDLNITVENTGSTVLETCDFNILIDGANTDFYCKTSYLYPDNDTYFEVYNQAGVGSKRIKIVTNNGICEYDQYTIT